MNLIVHVFNVDHGDSIVLEFESDAPKYLVIDSRAKKINGTFVNPAADYLKSKGATDISAVILTHFHQDHYLGIDDFFESFNVQKLVTPPVFSHKSVLFNKLLARFEEKIKLVVSKSASETIQKPMLSLAYLINWIANNEDRYEGINGKESILRLPGIPSFSGIVYLPLPKMKGIVNQKILDSDFQFDNWPLMNDMSLAVKIEIHGKKLLFAGDSTLGQWKEHQRQMNRDGVSSIAADILKVSHHGSRENNTHELFKYLLAENSERKIVLISANGVSHPHDELFSLVESNRLRPYCTNLAKQCAPKNLIPFQSLSDTPKEQRPFLVHYMEKKSIPCQGNIRLTISDSSIKVNNSTGTPCIYQ